MRSGSVHQSVTRPHRNTQQTTMHTPTVVPYCVLELPINRSHVFGLCEEDRVGGDNPHIQGESMQTPCEQGFKSRSFYLQDSSAGTCSNTQPKLSLHPFKPTASFFRLFELVAQIKLNEAKHSFLTGAAQILIL